MKKSKIVYAAQLKATVGYVYDDPPCLANKDGSMGMELDAIFGSNSVYNRIVNSPFLMGMTNTLLVEMSKKVADTYFNSKK